MIRSAPRGSHSGNVLIGVGGDSSGQHFDRDLPWQSRIGRAIDLAHSAFADLRGNLVGTEACARGESHGTNRFYRTIVYPLRETPRSCLMPFLIGCMALSAPRLALAIVFVFSNYLGRAYQSALWPLLGFFFIPLTTLAYA